MTFIKKNEQGMVLVTILLILVAATIMGISIMRTATLETRIAGNERNVTEQEAVSESLVDLTLSYIEDNGISVVQNDINDYIDDVFVDTFPGCHEDYDVTIEQLPSCPSGFTSCYRVTTRYGNHMVEVGITFD